MSEQSAEQQTPAPAPAPAPAPLKVLLGYLREHRRVLAFVVALSVLGAALTLAQPLVVNRIISSVGTDQPLKQLITVLIALVLAAGLIGAFQQYLLERTAEGVVLTARRRLVSHLLRLPVRVYDVRRTGDLVSRVGSDTTMVRAALTGGLIDALGGSLIFIGALIGMLVIDAVLLGITLAVVAVAVASVLLASSRIQSLTQSAQEAVGRLSAGVERALSAVRSLRANGATDRTITELHGEAGAAYDYGVRIARVGAVLWPVSGLATQVCFLAVLGVGGYRVAAGLVTVADLVTFIFFLFMMVTPLAQFFSAIITVRTALGALARIHDILDLPCEESFPRQPETILSPRLTAASPATTTGRPAAPRGSEVALDRVCFAYRPGQPVLTDVSLTVPAGSTTAIVGPSGSGKSTLFALIERFYDLDGGAIQLNGTDIRDLPRAALRAQIGYVEQDAAALAGTIGENLTLAAPDADQARCREVLIAVNLWDRICEHPDALDAPLGDDGIGLSGGERQRLAIARALLADAPLLLLDEPTASVDSRNEHALQEAIRAAAPGRTVIIVAHRLATVAGADQIAVLEAGRITATGTHDQLMSASALYHELAHHQLLT